MASPPLPDLDSLRAFVAAAERLNFRAAAREVGLSPTAFSDRIRRLEDSLDARLFERTTRTVRLTRAGMRLLPEARRCLEQALRCVVAASEDGQLPPFSLVLGTRYELGLSWVVPTLRPLKQARPERTIHLYFGQNDDLMERLINRRLDAVISSARLTRGGLSYAALHPEDYVFVATAEVLRRHPLTCPGDAAHHTLVDAGPPLPLFRYLLDALGTADDWPFAEVEHMGTIAAIRHRVLEGVGVAVLPLYFVHEDISAGRIVRLMPDVQLERDAFRLIWRQGDARQGELRALAEELRVFPLA